MSKGARISLVLDCLTHTGDSMIGTTVPDCRQIRVLGAINPQIKGCRRVTVFDAVLANPGKILDVHLDEQSAVIAHGLSPAEDVFRCVELCSGIACSSSGLLHAGFRHVCSVEWRAPFVDLHRVSKPGIPVVQGDISDPSCLKEVACKVDPPFTLMTGFSCQPYSTGGAQGGSNDERSDTVPATVRAVHLFQSPVLIIENVTQARSNQFVRACLKQLETVLGYQVSELTLKLEDNWCARRHRWWFVAVHPAFGPISIPDWPKNPSLTIRDVMPFIKSWPIEDLEQLRLSPHEAARFTMDGSSLRKYMVQTEGKLPTSLHSCGSQAGECPCGCRRAFSDQLLRQRGVYAQLIQLHSADGGIGYRHLHPVELSLLNAMIPPESWMSRDRPCLRLCLSAIGQLASPMQSVWVGSCLMQQLYNVLELESVAPYERLCTFKGQLRAFAKDLFPDVTPGPKPAVWTTLVYPDNTKVQVQVQPDTTVIELFQAEMALQSEASSDQWIDASTGQQLDYFTCVAGLEIRVKGTGQDPASPTGLTPWTSSDQPIPVTFEDPEQEDSLVPVAGSTSAPSASVPSSMSLGPPEHASGSGDAMDLTTEHHVVPGHVMDTLHGLRNLTGHQLADLVPPLVSDKSSCLMFRREVVNMESRLDVLSNEGLAMGDDELNIHLQACVKLCGRSDVQYLDPLLTCSWLQGGSIDVVRDWLDQFPSLTTIVTAVLVKSHWIPIVWTAGISDVQVALWEHVDVDVDFLNPLHGLVSSAWGRPMFGLACTRRSFARGLCGAAAVAFVSHRLLGHDLPSSYDALLLLHQDLKASFAATCRTAHVLPKPWCWGFGTADVFGLASELLQAHGVPASQAPLRAKLIVQSLGKADVQKALHGTSPWKSLKALANLQSPPLQMVLPDEQAQHSQVKQVPKQNSKTKKPAAVKKFAPSRPADLDPAKLQLEPGAFCVGQDEPVSQVSFAMFGPLATGVALSTFQDAQPFLQAGQLLTNHGLALLILNPPTEVQTSLTTATIRFAARCSMNQEPMIVTGLLVQLGKTCVYQYTAKDTPAVITTEVACARITVYKDQWEHDWEEFTSRPVKHVLSVLQCLQTCRNGIDCTCQGWHPGQDQPPDAVLDVFRRQYFNDSGRPVKWDSATHFAVFVRYAKCLESRVLAASGQHGVYVEPKSGDALKPHGDYQVVWLPQMDLQTVAHKAKCEVDCLGLARTGQRYGLRVHVRHFQRLFTSAKPEAVYLAPGTRMVYHCGPWPFGSDRKSIARILKSSQWECRPLQPVQHVSGGLMWSVQAVHEPPVRVLSLQHGQVVITCPDTKPPVLEVEDQVVGQAATVKLCRPSDACQDPWLTSDPWSKAISAAPMLPAGPPAQPVLQELEQRIEQSILAKLPPADKMEVDDQDHRLQLLEAQVQQLTTRQVSLENTVQENHQQNTAQVQSLQQQMKVQMDLQTHQMQSMLTDQMARIETILAKKPRTE